MTTLHQLTDNCLAVAGLPMDAHGFSYHNKWLSYYSKQSLSQIHIPTGNWRILGKANELTEEQWKEVVQKMDWGNDCYKNYGLDPWSVQYIGKTATESAASLLKLHQLENPLILIKE